MPRPFPHDLHAEASILGGVLLCPEALDDLADLDPEDFYDPKHRYVMTAMRTLRKSNTRIDTITLGDALRTAQRLEAVGGIAFLGRLALKVATPDNIRHHADIVRRHARARRIMLGLSEVLEAGHEGEPPHELLARAQQALRSNEDETIGFASAALRIRGEADRRRELVARELAFNVTFLDDYLRSILPHDLILVGAYTGAGKTQLVQLIAKTNAQAGKRVYFLALEAEPDEIERRTKFGVLADMAYAVRRRGRERLNYPDWYRGRCDDIVGPFDAEADRWIADNLESLYTLYRGSGFHIGDIETHFLAIRDRADLIILDHLHYVDSEDANENRAFKNIVKRIRDLSLAIGVPVIVVAHLRKRDRVRRTVVPALDDFHGASDITKISTAAILLSRARDNESSKPYIAHTYMQVVKSRQGGLCPYVAVLGYDLRRNGYEEAYALGRLTCEGDAVTDVPSSEHPWWAHNAIDPTDGGRE